MDANNEIRLRFRFYKDVTENIDLVRQKFENYKLNCTEDCHLKIRHNHIWMNIPDAKREYWSPHLHLELEPKRKQRNPHPRIVWSRTHFMDAFYVFAFYGSGNFSDFQRHRLLQLCFETTHHNGFNRNVADGYRLVFALLHRQTNPI